MFARYFQAFRMQTQTFMGLAIAALSVLGLIRATTILRASRMAQKLADKAGSERALLVVRGLLSMALLFGLALAARFVNPRA